MTPRTRLMLTVALGLRGPLVVLATLVRLLEPRFAFFPIASESVMLSDFGVDYDLAALRTRDDERLCSWSLADPAARARLVYEPVLHDVGLRGRSFAGARAEE